jgi:hypothetical protein
MLFYTQIGSLEGLFFFSFEENLEEKRFVFLMEENKKINVFGCLPCAR